MAKKSSKNNRKRGKKVVSRKSSSRRDKLRGLSAMAVKAKFDFKKTITENYARAGFVDSLNKDVKIQESKAARLIPGAVDEMEYVNIDDLPDIRISSKLKTLGSKNKKQKGVSPDEVAYLTALKSKHGDNFSAMARDIKLNNLQYSADVLRTKLAKLPKNKSAAGGEEEMEG